MISAGQAAICTQRLRDGRDRVWVSEKLDGSCCGVARLAGEIVPIGRAGYPAITSPFQHHHLFASWVLRERARFAALLSEGERVMGEWLALAHGTRYDLPHEPFVPFDLMTGDSRVRWADFRQRVEVLGFTPPFVLSVGQPFSVAAVEQLYVKHGSQHGAIGLPEGAVWRVERDGRFDFMAKWVRSDKVDGCLLPEVSGGDPVWCWWPDWWQASKQEAV